MNGRQLYATRIRLGWTQFQMGKVLGISKTAVNRLEQDLPAKCTNIASQRAEALTRICDAGLASYLPKPMPYVTNAHDIRNDIARMDGEQHG